MSQNSNEILRVEGRAVPVRGDDIDTDRIIPARFLRCVTFDGLGEHAFEDDRKQLEGAHPFDNAAYQGASILICGGNFGCGSSREHAPQSLMRWGIHGIVGESFAEIFFGNCVALGIPCFTLSRDEIGRIQDTIEGDPQTSVAMDVESRKLTVGDETIDAMLPEGVRQALTSGKWDSLSLLLEDADRIETVAGALPYVSTWPFAAAE